MADGTSYQIDVGVSGAAGADSAAASLERMADQLTAASAASTASSDAVKVADAAYNQLQKTADQASKALERIQVAADAQRGKLAAALEVGDQKAADAAATKIANLTARETEATTKSHAAKAALDAQASTLDKLRTSADAAAKQESALSSQMDKASAAAKTAAKSQTDHSAAAAGGSVNLRALAGAFGRLGGPVGDAGRQVLAAGGAVQRLMGQLGAAGPIVAAVILSFALAAGFAAATIAITKFGIESADAARTQGLLSDGIARSYVGGRQLDATIDSLRNQVPQTRQELLSMAEQLANTGLRGDALSKTLADNAKKAALLKFGPDFPKQMLSLTNQADRLHTNIAGTFGGLNIEKFLGNLSTVVALFDSSTESGKALKSIFEGFFQPVVDGAADMLPKVEGAFLDIEIYTLEAIIAIKPYSHEIILVGEAFALLAALALVALGIIAAVIVVPLAMLVAAAYAVVDLGEKFTAAAKDVSEFTSSIVDGASSALDLSAAVKSTTDYLSSVSLVDIGTELVRGLAVGITAGAHFVSDALIGVMHGGIHASRTEAQVNSPSRLTADQIGAPLGEGVAVGIEGQRDRVDSAFEGLGTGADMGSATSFSNVSSSKVSTSTGTKIFNFYLDGSKEAKELAISIRDQIEDLLFEDATGSGAGLPDSPVPA